MANGESIYDYDSIGNRLFAALDAATNSYNANALNQYTQVDILAPPSSVLPKYDADGNMLTNGVWSFEWDGENRLKEVYSNDVLVVSNVYDDQSRRIRKTTDQGTRTFLYDGWNPFREIVSGQQSAVTNYYCWGADLSGTLQGAGGVGGLLAVMVDGETSATYYPCYDANGNITAYVDESGEVKAKYAYDAFGQTISQGGDMEAAFSHRFSTKYADDETGLYYYGYRYYAPGLGRWVSRDPIEEEGGINILCFCNNESINGMDMMGLLNKCLRRCCVESVEIKNLKLVLGAQRGDIYKNFPSILVDAVQWPQYSWGHLFDIVIKLSYKDLFVPEEALEFDRDCKLNIREKLRFVGEHYVYWEDHKPSMVAPNIWHDQNPLKDDSYMYYQWRQRKGLYSGVNEETIVIQDAPVLGNSLVNTTFKRRDLAGEVIVSSGDFSPDKKLKYFQSLNTMGKSEIPIMKGGLPFQSFFSYTDTNGRWKTTNRESFHMISPNGQGNWPF